MVTCARRPVTLLTVPLLRCARRRVGGHAHRRHRRRAWSPGRRGEQRGGAPFALAADASHNFHRKIIELNLLSALLVSQRANAVMQKQDGGGTIVNITSVSAGRPSPGTAAYGAAKAGLESLTRSLAVEWAPKVRVNASPRG